LHVGEIVQPDSQNRDLLKLVEREWCRWRWPLRVRPNDVLALLDYLVQRCD
jgi:hypothetical protein